MSAMLSRRVAASLAGSHRLALNAHHRIVNAGATAPAGRLLLEALPATAGLHTSVAAGQGQAMAQRAAVELGMGRPGQGPPGGSGSPAPLGEAEALDDEGKPRRLSRSN